MALQRVLLVSFLITSSVLVIGKETAEPDDDVDRTDFTEEHLKEDPVSVPSMGPHSEVESASLLVDLVSGNVPIGVPSYLLCALANLGGKMFNVSSISGSLQGTDGKELQKLTRRSYGESLGPREQRSFRFGFCPDEKIPPGKYRLKFTVLYNNREKDQFNDTVFDEIRELVPAPSANVKLRLIQVSICGLLAIMVLFFVLSRRPGKPPPASTKSSTKTKSSANSAVKQDEWLAATMAVTEGTTPKKRKPKRA